MKDIKILIAESGVLSKYDLCGHGCGQPLEERWKLHPSNCSLLVNGACICKCFEEFQLLISNLFYEIWTG